MSRSLRDIPSSGGGTRELLEPDVYTARLVQVIYLGLQPQSYQGQQKDPKEEVMLTYEFVTEFLKDEDGQDLTDKPRWLSESFALHPLSSDKAKSTLRMAVLDPNQEGTLAFNDYLGAPVKVFVSKDPSRKDPTKVYNNVERVMPMRAAEAEKLPALVNEPRTFDPDDPNLEDFLALPKFVQEKIKGNLRFEGSDLQGMLASGGAPAKSEATASSGAGAATNPEPAADENPY